MKSSLVKPNMSTDALQAYRPAPVSLIISMNSWMGGMSSAVHLLLHHVGGDGRHAGKAADQGGHVHAGVADGGDLDVLDALGVDGVEAEEREEQVGLDALGAGAVGHDQRRGRCPRGSPWR